MRRHRPDRVMLQLVLETAQTSRDSNAAAAFVGGTLLSRRVVSLLDL